MASYIVAVFNETESTSCGAHVSVMFYGLRCLHPISFLECSATFHGISLIKRQKLILQKLRCELLAAFALLTFEEFEPCNVLEKIKVSCVLMECSG